MASRSAIPCGLSGLILFALLPSVSTAQSRLPEMPNDVPVLLPGDPLLDGDRLPSYSDVRFALGRVGKESALATGESIDARAYQSQTLERREIAGIEALVRSFSTTRADTGEEVARGAIYLDARSLLPLKSEVIRQGQTTTTEYDWDAFVVRQRSTAADAEPIEEGLDIPVFEAAAHETWMAALPWHAGFSARIPTILAGGGGKWWAVPRVVGSAEVDIGDAVLREAWVVELDWWGMGKDHRMFTAGGRADGSAGPGGMYWVLKDAPDGLPPVVRIRTEVDNQSDMVNQMQDGLKG